ncbi:hypothetical protein Tco_0158110 [Tanacetum coccineum]
MEDPRESFNELMDTPLDFSAFVMNRLKVDTLTPELLAGPTFELMKGTCKSLVELEYFFEEVYKATTEKLDWNNPEGQQYPHDLRKPLPLIPNSRGRQVIPFDHFINNDLAYLCGGVSSRTYATSKHRIIAVTKLQIVKWHSYKHLDWIIVHREYDKLYAFKEGNFKRLRLQDIEDMLILLVQGKLTNLNVEERVESYQKKLNITKPDTYKSDLKRRDAYTAYSNPRGFIYQNKYKKKKLMRIDELHKLSDDFCYSDTERLSRSDKVLKLKNFKKDATLKLFKSTNQERYEHVSPEVTSSQDGKAYKMNKEFLEELQKNTYHGWIDEDVIDHIAKEELVEKFFCKFYPDSYDKEDKMLNEGDNWGIDPLKFISRVNSSFDKHMKIDGRTKKVLFYAWINGSWNKRRMDDSILSSNNTSTNSFFKPYLITHGKSDTEKEDEKSQTKRKYSNTSNSIDEQPNKRRCKAEKFEAIQYSLGPNEEYIAIRGYEFDIWERNKDNLSIIYQDIFQKKDEGWKVTRTKANLLALILFLPLSSWTLLIRAMFDVSHDKLRVVVFPISLAGAFAEDGALWDYWKMGGDEIEVSDNESSDLKEYWSYKEEETAEIFKIEN